jgi:hypothetical protein
LPHHNIPLVFLVILKETIVSWSIHSKQIANDVINKKERVLIGSVYLELFVAEDEVLD